MNRDYTDEDGQPLSCEDCGQNAYYDYEDEAYHHADRPQDGCGLIPAEQRARDESHPLTKRQSTNRKLAESARTRAAARKRKSS